MPRDSLTSSLQPLASKLAAALERHQANDLAEAARLYREILADEPRHPDAMHMLGIIARQKGNNELALKLIEAALAVKPDMALGWYNRSLILRAAGRKDEALQSAEQALGYDANMADAWDAAAMLWREKKQLDKARAAHERALALRPDDLKFLGNYALMLHAEGELEKAYRIMRRIERRDPNILLHTMGNILIAAGYPERAIHYYKRSRALLPDNKDVPVTQALAHLLIGDFAEGWKIWETRPSLNERFGALPFWQGQKLDHLLLYEDQGLGDMFQCVRYIPQLLSLPKQNEQNIPLPPWGKGRGGGLGKVGPPPNLPPRGEEYIKRITLQGPHTMKALVEASFPEIEFLTYSDPVPAAAERMRLLSLPAFFHTDSTNIPQNIPYMKVLDEWQQPWRERLKDIPKPRIGIVWGGNPNHHNDRLRSIPFADFAPVLQAGKQHIVSLQKGGHREGIDLAAAGIFDADLLLNDFAETAGLMAELDLVISVDTATVHLAGAIGLPVWVLLPFEPDWRWLLEREDSPWYPKARLFRQQEPRNWPRVMERVADDLKRFLSGDAGVLQPKHWQGENLRQHPRAVRLPE